MLLGFVDLKKNNDLGYFYFGLFFCLEFGDLLIWEQVFDEVIRRVIEEMIFVIDDLKVDWWWKVGSLIIGGCLELREEVSW